MKSKSAKTLFFFVLVLLMGAVTASALTAAAAEESAIESITVEKVTLIKDYDGSILAPAQGEPYFHYYTSNPSKVTVYFSNGKTMTDSFENIEKYFDQQAIFEDSQSADSPWVKGSYFVSYSFMGYEGQYLVEIIDNPVEKITAKDIELYFRTDGYYNQDVFVYNSQPDEVTVYYKDGTVKSGTADSFGELTDYEVTVKDNQSKTAWGIGKYKCQVSYLGVSANYYVTVKESPVKSISIEDAVIYEGIDGSYGVDGKFYYDAKPEKVTVFYKDGTALTGSTEEIEAETGYKVSFDTKKALNYGSQVATASFLGASAKFNVNVKKNPISNIEISRNPEKTLYYAGELYDFEGAAVKVTYTDGKTEEAELVQNYETDFIEFRLETIGKTLEIYTGIEVGADDEEIFVYYFDDCFTVDVNVREERIEKAELDKNEYGVPFLRFTFSDGEKASAEIKNIVCGNYNDMALGSSASAVIITDLGSYSVFITRMLEGYSLEFSSNVGDNVVTNFCDGIIWAESAMTEKARIIYNSYNGIDSYSGLVASDNIDCLLSFAAFGSKAGKPKEIHKDYYVYTSTEIQKSIKDFFAIDGIDVSLSKKFDTKNNTVKIEKLYNDSCELYSYGEGVAYPVSYSFVQGFFKATYKFSDGKTMDLIADENGRVVSYKVNDALIHKHVMVTVLGTEATYFKTGLTDGVKCSSCGEILTEQKETPKLVLGKTSKLVATQSTTAIKLSWVGIKGVTGYEIFYKTGNSTWKNASTTTATSIIFKNLPSGKIYTFAVKAYVIENGKLLKASTYTTIQTATQPLKPSKVVSAQNNNAIKLAWAKSAGATGYRVYYKSAGGWKSLGETVNNTATFKNLKPGTRYIFAVRPYMILSGSVIWSDSYATFVAATTPMAPSVKATSSATGKVSLTFSGVSGAEAYQVFYKTGNGSFKLYKNYTSTGTINFASLKSGTTYTFAVRAAKNTSGGWIFGSYNTASVTVK